MNKVLSIQNLSKIYTNEESETIAIENISFDVYDNEIVALIGTSGCGKSTLLNILTGIESSTKGKLIFSKKNPSIGYMLQSDCLFPWLTIYQNAILALKIKHMDTKENIDYVKQLLKTYQLEEFSNSYPKELSGGMRQRVALIRTLALKPDILLLDEPFGALDYQSRLNVSEDVFRIIKQERIATIIVTHDIAEAISMADRIIVLSKRPSHIKKIYKIDLDTPSTPIQNRNDSKFRIYYDQIWRNLDEP